MCFVVGHNSSSLIFVGYFQMVILSPERPQYLTDPLMAFNMLIKLPAMFSPDATHPEPLKHWVFTNIHLGQ